jgi:hypothetical protein
VRSALAQIEAAFGDAPRPPDDELLHERCMDDNDIVRLYPVPHWRDLPDELVESEYDIWSLAAVFYEDAAIQEFTVSKFASFTESQRAAVIAFLEAVIETGDDYVAEQAGRALSWWRAP